MHGANRNRLTAVVTRTSSDSWNRAGVLWVDSLQSLQDAVAANDVERIVIDRCASAEEFLHLLAALPGELAGDVMCVRDDGGAFLSAGGRGGDRVLYALAPGDVDFYFRTYGLTAMAGELALIA
jgi:hypothetical protein